MFLDSCDSIEGIPQRRVQVDLLTLLQSMRLCLGVRFSLVILTLLIQPSKVPNSR